jgi:hypothetical protein
MEQVLGNTNPRNWKDDALMIFRDSSEWYSNVLVVT